MTRGDSSSDWSALAAALRAAGLRATESCPLGERTTYRVGGPAALGVWVGTPDEAATLGAVLGAVPHGPPRILVVGNGSNLLVADEGFDGVAVFVDAGATGNGAQVARRDAGVDAVVVTVRAEEMLPTLARRFVAAGWCGAEWMVGVPGTIGGAVRMNAGGHGSDMAAMLVSADIVDLGTGTRARIAVGDLGLRFRGSALADRHLVLSADIAVHAPRDHGERTCQEELAAIVAWRRERQPGGHNAGSVFVNPGEGGDSAGALVDGARMRGHRRGSAAVSDKHANFIQSDQGGRAADVVAVMCDIQEAVLERRGVRLRSEVRLVGFPEEISARFAAHADYGVDDAAIAAAAARLVSLL